MKKESAMADQSANPRADSMKNAYKAVSTAWDAGNVDEFDKYVSVNSVDHNAMPGMKPGLAGMKEFAKVLKTAYPDMKSTIEDMRADGDVLTVRFAVTGTNSGPMHGGMPATNKKMTGVEGINMMRWENGKFVESWGLFDAMNMMEQLGMMPPMPGHPDMGKDMGKDSSCSKKKM
jgi:predicted ester cyclase